MEIDTTNKTKHLEIEQDFNVKFIDPETLIEKLELEKGMIVADFGCGSGFFSLPIAEKVGEQGIVYALDILPSSLETVSSQAKLMGLTNIITKRVNLEKEGGSRLEDSSCDWVIIKAVLYQNKNKLEILSEARRVVKSNGKILVVEWNMNDNSMGPDKNLRISREALVDLVGKADLGVFKEIPVSNFHYGMILTK